MGVRRSLEKAGVTSICGPRTDDQHQREVAGALDPGEWMPDGYPQPVFLDATVSRSLASTNSIEFLVHALEAPVVALAARAEIEQGVDLATSS